MLATLETPAGAGLTQLTYKGRPACIARELGVALGYADGGRGLVAMIRRDWREEFREGVDYVLLEGDELRALEQALDGGEDSSRRRQRLLLLLEPGVTLACLLSRRPAGRKLRRWLADEVFPQLARTGAFDPAKRVDEAGQVVVDERPVNEEALSVHPTSTARLREERLARQLQVEAIRELAELLERDRAPARHLLPVRAAAVKAAGGPSLSGVARVRPPAGYLSPTAIARELSRRHGTTITAQRVGQVISRRGLRTDGQDRDIPGTSWSTFEAAPHGATMIRRYYYAPHVLHQVEVILRADGLLAAA